MKKFTGLCILFFSGICLLGAQTIEARFSGNNHQAFKTASYTDVVFTFYADSTYTHEAFPNDEVVHNTTAAHYIFRGWYSMSGDTLLMRATKEPDPQSMMPNLCFLYDPAEQRIIDLNTLVDYTREGKSRLNKKTTVIKTDPAGNVLANTILYVPYEPYTEQAPLSPVFCLRNHIITINEALIYAPWTYQPNFIIPGSAAYDRLNRLVTYCPQCDPMGIARSYQPPIYYFTYRGHTSYLDKIGIGSLKNDYYRFIYNKNKSVARINKYNGYGRLTEIIKIE